MGAVDLVVQVESPPSVASGLQRVGRAGHQVGAVSRGVLFPKFRGDLVQTAVVVERMLAGQIEALHLPATPLDVLAQQVVAMCALDEWTVDDVLALARRSASYSTLTRPVLESVLDMLAGRYPSDEFAELRARITWDRLSDTLTGRRGAQRLAVTSGGTIPDRGLYAVFLATGEGPGRRVGELDEEMVYESRVGDLFTLGTSTWRIEDITHDRVLVTPAPGLPGRLPFWKGDSLGRPAELGRAVGAFVREVEALTPDAARERVMAAGLDEWAADNLLGYLREQREATGHVPDDRTIVVERFRDELGDWRVAIQLAVRRPGARPVGAGRERPDARPVRRRRAGDARRRRHRAAPARPRARRPRRACASAGSAASCSTSSPSTPTTCAASSPRRSAARRSSPRGSASAPPGPCSSPVAAPTAASRCGSSASGPRSCSRWPASTRPSPSCSRPCASASRTSSTCRAWST